MDNFKFVIISILILLMFIYLKYSSIETYQDLNKNSKYFNDILSISERTRLKLLTSEIIKHFESSKITYFFAFGSLLGVVRHGQRMPWDDDVDLIISNRDVEKLTKNLLIIKRENDSIYYKLTNDIVIKKKNWGIPIKVYYRDNTYPFIDINTYYEENNYLVVPKEQLVYGHIDHFKELKSDIFPLKQGKFDNIVVNIPNKFRKILINQYGHNVLDVAYITYNHKPYCNKNKNSHGCENNNASESVRKK